jgi:hypothetical protein
MRSDRVGAQRRGDSLSAIRFGVPDYVSALRAPVDLESERFFLKQLRYLYVAALLRAKSW